MAMAGTLLSILMLAGVLLTGGGVYAILRTRDRKRGALMIVAGLVMFANVAITSMPGPDAQRQRRQQGRLRDEAQQVLRIIHDDGGAMGAAAQRSDQPRDGRVGVNQQRPPRDVASADAVPCQVDRSDDPLYPAAAIQHRY